MPATNATPDQPPVAERPRGKAAQREATMAALIDAAETMFAERGYAAVGTEEIVRSAGVTRGALYHHFRGGKSDLFRAVVAQISAEIAQQMNEAAAAADAPSAALALAADSFLDACATPRVQRIMFIDGPAVFGWEEWRDHQADYPLRLFERTLQEAIDAGEYVPHSAIAVAHILIAALSRAAMVVTASPEPEAARTEMRDTIRQLLNGLRSPAS